MEIGKQQRRRREGDNGTKRINRRKGGCEEKERERWTKGERRK